MDIRMYERGALYCDVGIHAGQFRIEFSGSVYLTQEEYAAHRKFTLTEEAEHQEEEGTDAPG